MAYSVPTNAYISILNQYLSFKRALSIFKLRQTFQIFQILFAVHTVFDFFSVLFHPILVFHYIFSVTRNAENFSIIKNNKL